MISLTYKKNPKQITQNKTKTSPPPPSPKKNPKKQNNKKLNKKPLKILFSLLTILKLYQKYIFIEFS